MKIVQIDNLVFQPKLGLKDLILLSKKLNMEEAERDLFIFSLVLNANEMHIPKAQVEELANKYEGDFHTLIEDIIKDSVGDNFDITSSNENIEEQIEKLFQLCIGQLKMSPTLFFESSPHEIELIYLGYLKDKELTANILQKALKSDDKIDLLHGEVGLASMKERNQVFADLNI